MPAPSANGVKLIQESMLQNLKPVRSFAAATVSLAGFAISFLVVALVGSVQLHAYGSWSVLSLSQKGVVLRVRPFGAGALAVSMSRQMRSRSKYDPPPSCGRHPATAGRRHGRRVSVTSGVGVRLKRPA